MNNIDMVSDLLNRSPKLNTYVVDTDLPDNFQLEDAAPFDIKIIEGTISAQVPAVDFNQACLMLNTYLETRMQTLTDVDSDQARCA